MPPNCPLPRDRWQSYWPELVQQRLCSNLRLDVLSVMYLFTLKSYGTDLSTAVDCTALSLMKFVHHWLPGKSARTPTAIITRNLHCRPKLSARSFQMMHK